MRVAEVIGRVTMSRAHPSLKGGRFLVTLPMPLAALRDASDARGEEVIAYDELGAGAGDLIALSEGREAAEAALHYVAPVDEKEAYVTNAFRYIAPYLPK